MGATARRRLVCYRQRMDTSKEWTEAKRRVSDLVHRKNLDDINKALFAAHATIKTWTDADGRNARRRPPAEVVAAEMEVRALEEYFRSVMRDRDAGRQIQLSRWDMFVAQRLFFTRWQERRLPSVRTFRKFW